MKIIDLFSGIGGFSFAGHLAGWETVAFIEWDRSCRDVIRKNFPGVPVFGDIRDFNGKKHEGTVDIICGGFPCQPFSLAGNRQGADDDRYLWPEMLRVISEAKPRWVVAENVAGILSMDGGRVFADIRASLENEGYQVEVYLLPAISVGAPHRRERIWIVAHNESAKRQQSRRTRARRERLADGDSVNTAVAESRKAQPAKQGGFYTQSCSEDRITNTDPDLKRPQGHGQHGECAGERATWSLHWEKHWLEAVAGFCGVDDGLPDWLDVREKRIIRKAVEQYGAEEVGRRTGIDCRKVEEQAQRTARLKMLGNSIVPQVAYEIFRAINEVEDLEDSE